MSTSRPALRPPRGLRKAFTLVELLVVIGIIAVLIAILLPALQSARRQASMVQCSSNMRQIAMAMLMYIDANQGNFPPNAVGAGLNVAGPGVAWWWPNELVKGKYINNPSLNVYAHYATPPAVQSDKKFANSNPFKCPEGINEDFSGGSMNFPTDAGNNRYALEQDTNAALHAFGVATWYQLASRNQNASNTWPTGDRQSPFVWYNSTATFDQLKSRAFSRKISMVKKSSELIMLVEAANPNWYDQEGSTTVGDETTFLRRLGARHGKRSKHGLNAWTNFAFFDGHVKLYPTIIFQSPKNKIDEFYQETIFHLNRQKGR